jgi:hypothetical protein
MMPVVPTVAIVAIVAVMVSIIAVIVRIPAIVTEPEIHRRGYHHRRWRCVVYGRRGGIDWRGSGVNRGRCGRINRRRCANGYAWQGKSDAKLNAGLRGRNGPE